MSNSEIRHAAAVAAEVKPRSVHVYRRGLYVSVSIRDANEDQVVSTWRALKAKWPQLGIAVRGTVVGEEWIDQTELVDLVDQGAA